MRTTFLKISARIRSDVQDLMTALHLTCLTKWQRVHVASSRGKRDCGTDPSSNPKAWRVRAALKCGTREKGVHTLDVLPLSLPSGSRGSGTEESGSLSQTSHSRGVSTCKRDLWPNAMKTPHSKAVVDEEWKEIKKKAHKRKVHFVPSMVLRQSWSTSTAQGMFARTISSVQTILYSMNLYIEDDFLKVSHERRVRNQDVYNTVGSGEGQGQRHPSPNTLYAAGSIVLVVLIDISFVVQRVSYPRGGSYCVYDGVCTHTPCRTHSSFGCTAHIACALSAAHFQMWSHHIWLKGMIKKVCVCFAHVINLHILHSSLMSHPSLSAPSLLFPHGQRDWSAVPGFLSDVSRSKISGQAHSDIGNLEFGYLATSFHLTGSDCSGCFLLLFQVLLGCFGVVLVVFGGLKLFMFLCVGSDC